MTSHPLALLGTRRFLPLFVTQFLGAFNDNLLKNAVAILIVYRLASSTSGAQMLVTAAGGIFILPFFLFSATAGQLADRWQKAYMARAVKVAEVALMALAAYAFAVSSTHLMLLAIFGMGVHSTFFGPIKYSLLPDHLAPAELVAGNALIEAGTFFAILLGTIAGGTLILLDDGVAIASLTLFLLAVAGLAASWLIPKAPVSAPDLEVDWNLARETVAIVRHAKGTRAVWLAILGISWFWLVGATYLSQFPAFAKDVLGGDERVVTLLLVMFSVGIGVGSALCSKLLGAEVSARHVPFAALAMTLFGVDLCFAAANLAPQAGALVGPVAFARAPGAWRVLLDLFMIAVSGGVYSVPLYAIVQSRADAAHRSRTIAANNIVNAFFMVLAAALTVAMLDLGVTVTQVFLVVAVANAGAAVVICGLLPTDVVKGVFRFILRAAYRVEVRGLEHYDAAGERAVIVANHLSFLDATLIGAFLPGKPTFAVNTFIAGRWYLKPFLAMVEAVAVDPTNPYATKTLVKAVKSGHKVVIFPEGRITVTGSLMKVYEGPGLVADKANAMILPIRLDGAEFTRFSRMRGKLRLRWFPKITMTVLPPRHFAVDPSLRGRRRRRVVGQALQDLMTDVAFSTRDIDRTLFAALVEARRTYGGATAILTDVAREPMTYDDLLRGSFVLGRRLARRTAPGAYVGLLLPNTRAAAVAFFGLHAMGRVPAMINHSTGAANVLLGCTAAALDTVVTSREFIARARLEALEAALAAKMKLIYLEDVRQTIGARDKLYGLVAAWRPLRFSTRRVPSSDAGGSRRKGRQMRAITPADPAVVLFTSGSEGAPKGVVHSHRSLLANCAQVASVIDFSPADTLFNAMPVFHSFGFTGGLLLPLVSGVPSFQYPSPLHYRIVPELIYDQNATIMFGTDSFLKGYARAAHPYDLYAIRYIIAGAEKVQDETRRVYMEKFQKAIYEGYGATETAPVLSLNTPMHFRLGTAGRLLPAIEHRIEAIAGIAEGGRLHVRGPNVMLGYLRVDRPGVIEPPEGGEYDTGDIVAIDAEGYVTIKDRAKRISKIAGEMVSHQAVEAMAAALWPDAAHAVLGVPDERRGEQLVLVTTEPHATRQALSAFARERGKTELMVPRSVLVRERLPILGTGKTDYVALREMVLAGAAAPEASLAETP